MYVDFNHVDGSKDMTEMVVVDDGEASVPVNDEYDLTSIKLYLSENAKYYEKVDVIMDGKSGTDGTSPYAAQFSNPADIVTIQNGAFVGFPVKAKYKVWSGNVDITTDVTVSCAENNYFTITLNSQDGTVTITAKDNLPIEPSRYTINFDFIHAEVVVASEEMTIIIQEAGGESATGIDVLNNYTNAVVESGEIINPISTTIQAYYGTSNECTLNSLKLMNSKTGSFLTETTDYTWNKVDNSNFYSITITPAGLSKLGLTEIDTTA